MEKDIEIYKKLKKLRKERGLTLANLADRIGSDYQQLSRIERGKSRLTVETLVKMAEAFDTPVDELFKEKSKNSCPAAVKNDAQPEHISYEGSQEEQLGVILEKLETVIQETKGAMRPQTKAAIAFQIYRESLQMSKAVDFAMNIIKAILSSK